MEAASLSESLKVLFLVVIGLGVTVGLIKLNALPKIFFRLLIAPIVIGVLYTVGLQHWQQLPHFYQQAALIVLLPVALIVVLRVILGADLFREILGNFLYDLLKTLFLALWRLLAQLFMFPVKLIRYLLRR